ncbi:MAG: hypothetical protein WBQ72_10345 [Terriglobales bacterium]
MISLIKVVLFEIRIQDFQGDYLPMETLLADFAASDYAVVNVTSPISLIAGRRFSSGKVVDSDHTSRTTGISLETAASVVSAHREGPHRWESYDT